MVEPFGTVVEVGAAVVEETETAVVEETTRRGAVVEVVGADGGGGARNATAGAAATAALTGTSLTGREPPSGPPNTRPSVPRTASPTSPTQPRRANRARCRDRSTPLIDESPPRLNPQPCELASSGRRYGAPLTPVQLFGGDGVGRAASTTTRRATGTA